MKYHVQVFNDLVERWQTVVVFQSKERALICSLLLTSDNSATHRVINEQEL